MSSNVCELSALCVCRNYFINDFLLMITWMNNQWHSNYPTMCVIVRWSQSTGHPRLLLLASPFVCHEFKIAFMNIQCLFYRCCIKKCQTTSENPLPKTKIIVNNSHTQKSAEQQLGISFFFLLFLSHVCTFDATRFVCIVQTLSPSDTLLIYISLLNYI